MDGEKASHFIRSTPALQAACEKARLEGILALDTEFVWRSTYRPQLGIVQLGCAADCWALDCQTGVHVEALRELVESAAVTKILHDARQDLLYLHHYTGAWPVNVFDTQLAAAFAGFRVGIGLQQLLFDAINVGLPKTETLTDWMHRPLTAAQIDYALDDVRYLPELRSALLARMDEFGTRAWFEEDSLKYGDEAFYEEGRPERAWLRMKIHRVRLDGRGRAILRALAARREELAQDWNLPRSWLGDDDSLAQIAAQEEVGRLRHRVTEGRGEVLRAQYAQVLREAAETPPEDWPDDPHRHYIQEVCEAASRAVEWLAERAKALHVDASLIANRATVTAYVDDVMDETNPLAHGWRYEVVGREMAERFGVD